MWDRFTTEARNIFFVADEEARHLRCNYISTEHILLGLLHDEESSAARILKKMGFALEPIKNELRRQMGSVGNMPYQPIQLTGNALMAIELAFNESKRYNADQIGTEHLLLGLLQNQGLAGRVLAHMGVELGSSRRVMESMRYGR